MLTLQNISAFSVIAEINNAIFLSRRKEEKVIVNIAGITLTVEPEFNQSETVALWEELWEEQQQKKK